MLATRLLAFSFIVLTPLVATAQNPPSPPTQDVGAAPPAPPQAPPKAAEAPENRPEFDYSAGSTEHPYVEIAGLVARDPRTGDIGAIVLSNSPGVGAMCVQAKAGAGVAVVSGNADPTWPIQAIHLLENGAAPAAVLDQLKAEAVPAARDRQQLVLLHADGRTAVHIGEYVFGGGKTTEASQQPDYAAFTTYAATQGLLVEMKKEFEAARGLPLPEQLLVALHRASQAQAVDKGKRADLNGRAVSAALIVVRKDGGRLGRGDRLVDLRVDYDQDPLGRLRGLYKVWSLAHLGPALRATLVRINDQQSEAYKANQEWMRRLRSRAKLGEKR